MTSVLRPLLVARVLSEPTAPLEARFGRSHDGTATGAMFVPESERIALSR
jgi:hypothetical protein